MIENNVKRRYETLSDKCKKLKRYTIITFVIFFMVFLLLMFLDGIVEKDQAETIAFAYMTIPLAFYFVIRVKYNLAFSDELFVKL